MDNVFLVQIFEAKGYHIKLYNIVLMCDQLVYLYARLDVRAEMFINRLNWICIWIFIRNIDCLGLVRQDIYYNSEIRVFCNIISSIEWSTKQLGCCIRQQIICNCCTLVLLFGIRQFWSKYHWTNWVHYNIPYKTAFVLSHILFLCGK